MPTEITATEAKNNFSDLLNRILYSNEEFIIKRQGVDIAIITSPPKAKSKTNQKGKKLTGIEFLTELTKYGLKGGPKDLAKNHDKYTWD